METALNRKIAAINFDFGGVITTSPFAAIGMQAIMVTSAGQALREPEAIVGLTFTPCLEEE